MLSTCETALTWRTFSALLEGLTAFRPKFNLARLQAGKATIIAVARRLFASRGCNGTSTEAVLEESKFSRGALYHHFETKEVLFAAVLEAVEVDITAATGRARENTDDPVKGLGAEFDSFLAIASESEVRQIELTDAHSVVGWQMWREIEDRHGLGRLKQALRFVAAAGRMQEDIVDVFAHILLASLLEVAFMVAGPPDPRAAARVGHKAMRELLARLLTKSGFPAGGEGMLRTTTPE